MTRRAGWRAGSPAARSARLRLACGAVLSISLVLPVAARDAAQQAPRGAGQEAPGGAGRQEAPRRAVQRPPGPPPSLEDSWRGLIGHYGPEGNELVVLERDGALWARLGFLDYELRQIGPDRFALAATPANGGGTPGPDGEGLYAGTEAWFTRGPGGRAATAVAAGVRRDRRLLGPVDGGTFRIDPLRPVEELRRQALASSPPPSPSGSRAPDLVDLAALDPGIRLDIRYATEDNFMGAVFYRQPRAFLQRPAAEALLRVHRRLESRGYGLLVYDAYRPWFVTRMFWDATPAHQRDFVADPAKGSRHNRGCAVDLTLYDRDTGEPVEMTGGYDEFSERSHAWYPGGTSRQRWHRDLLRQAMEAEGFTVYPYEWWHFDHRDWRHYPILNLTFEELSP